MAWKHEKESEVFFSKGFFGTKGFHGGNICYHLLINGIVWILLILGESWEIRKLKFPSIANFFFAF